MRLTSEFKPAYSETHRPQVTDEMLMDLAGRIGKAFRPQKIILFGSYAYGEPRPDSDVDLMVIMESEETLHQQIARVTDVARIPFLPMGIIVRTPAEIARRVEMGDHFVREILSKGRVLYSSDAA